MSFNQNNLSFEKSPYLLQHKGNPVHWNSWNSKALEYAKKNNKLIFLSIGYATCHWCHVMEHESFENIEVSKILNDNFVCIKVDREEMPDVDQLYMNALHFMGQRGGWPLSMFLTPDLKPIFGGTYFQRPQFVSILSQLSEHWKTSPAKILDSANSFFESFDKIWVVQPSTIPQNYLKTFFESCAESFDSDNGGFGGAPKFPPYLQIKALLWYFHKNKEALSLKIVESTLEQMYRGGLFDHLGKGFTRYCVDESWDIPHFEKMLYTNALLLENYTEAYQVTQKPLYKKVAEDIISYVQSYMTSPQGSFFSAEDADSEGEEGKFYVWTYEFLKIFFSPQEFQLFCEKYEVTERGNFEHHQIHLRVRSSWDFLRDPQVKPLEEKLLKLREKRIRPLLDDKVLTSWNGLMISSLCKAFRAFGNREYLRMAQVAGRFILDTLTDDNQIFRRFRDGERAYFGTLEDYAFFIQALIDLFLSDFDEGWLKRAIGFQAAQNQKFSTNPFLGYYSTENGSENLISRLIEFADHALPNSNGVAANNLAQLFFITGDIQYRERAVGIFNGISEFEKYPNSFASAVYGLERLNSNPKQVVISGQWKENPLEAFWKNYHPLEVFIDSHQMKASDLVLLQGKFSESPQIFVCELGQCNVPSKSADEARKLL